MTNTPTGIQQEQIQTRHKPEKDPLQKRNTIILSVLILLWGALLTGSYFLTNHYLDESKAYMNAKIEEVKKQNQQQMESIQTKLEQAYNELVSVKSELAYIKEDLDLTGETLNGTDKTKQALQQRIESLNTQLKDLQASIQRLEDAAKN